VSARPCAARPAQPEPHRRSGLHTPKAPQRDLGIDRGTGRGSRRWLSDALTVASKAAAPLEPVGSSLGTPAAPMLERSTRLLVVGTSEEATIANSEAGAWLTTVLPPAGNLDRPALDRLAQALDRLAVTSTWSLST
jgi:hypothetical protein